MLEILSRLLTWASVTRAQDSDGTVQVDSGDPLPLDGIAQVGTPGVYARAAVGVKGLLLRLLDAGIFFAADTEPPSDAQIGEVGFRVGDTVLRVQPDGTIEAKTGSTPTKLTIKSDGTVEITGSTAIKLDGATKIVRDADPVHDDTGIGSLSAWLLEHKHTGVTVGEGVSGAPPPLPAPPLQIGHAVASTTKLTGG